MEILNLLLRAELFGIELIDTADFSELFFRFTFNAIVCLIIVRYIYFPITQRKDYLFTYLLFSVVIFFVCFMLSNVKLGVGFALGLFALFGIIRYRTNAIAIKEMTYLFVIIGITVVNALANKKISYAELLFTNLAVIGFTYALEKIWLIRLEKTKLVLYEKIELIKPENYDELLKDLKDRTGLDIHKAEVERIDFLRDTARIIIYYYDRVA
jgi:hypothetical protein